MFAWSIPDEAAADFYKGLQYEDPPPYIYLTGEGCRMPSGMPGREDFNTMVCVDLHSRRSGACVSLLRDQVD